MKVKGLKPCPFCGGKAAMKKVYPKDWGPGGGWFIHCSERDTCDAGFIVYNKEEAIADWNNEDRFHPWAPSQLVNISLAIYREIDELESDKPEGVYGTRDFEDVALVEWLHDLLDYMHENAPGIPPESPP